MVDPNEIWSFAVHLHKKRSEPVEAENFENGVEEDYHGLQKHVAQNEIYASFHFHPCCPNCRSLLLPFFFAVAVAPHLKIFPAMQLKRKNLMPEIDCVVELFFCLLRRLIQNQRNMWRHFRWQTNMSIRFHSVCAFVFPLLYPPTPYPQFHS